MISFNVQPAAQDFDNSARLTGTTRNIYLRSKSRVIIFISPLLQSTLAIFQMAH